MTAPTSLTPEDRVAIMVGGRFSADAVGQDAYDAFRAAVDADPGAHLDAFERMFLSGRPQRRALTELMLAGFLARMQSHAPARVAALAARLSAQMASLARQQAGEAAEADGESAGNEIARQRRQLDRQREGLATLLQHR